jgi:amidophosphoribosyltransferase
VCGIVGAIGSEQSALEVFLSLSTLQHRGQDSAGIAIDAKEGLKSFKHRGLVDAQFSIENISPLLADMAVGHTRYSTSGLGSFDEIQPFCDDRFAIAHNGQVTNEAELEKYLFEKYDYKRASKSDSELLFGFIKFEWPEIERLHAKEPTVRKVQAFFDHLFHRAKGSFSIVAMIHGVGLVAVRGPNGIRPLMWGRNGESHLFSSESVAGDFCGFLDGEDVPPGQGVFIESGSFQVHRFKIDLKREFRPCMFEWVYFASPESVLDQIPVYRSRLELGEALLETVNEVLAKKGIEIDIVVPVPETSRIASIALAEKMGKPYRELLIKNRYIQRTFILDTTLKRQRAVHHKLKPVRKELEGKSVLLVDDSIVRGTTSKKIVELVRAAGAKTVVFVSTCPPIRHPCPYGIDFPNPEVLIAAGRTEEEIEKLLAVDALVYQPLEGLVRTLGKVKPCMACLDGNYPEYHEARTEVQRP